MTSETMVRVGRGGAGNYHSAPVNSAQSKNAVSLASGKNQTVNPATQPASAPTLTGRGGAGNVLSEPNAAAHAEGKIQLDLEAGRQVTATEAAAEVAAASSQQPLHEHQQHYGVLSGRGGAGNWRGGVVEALGDNSTQEAAQIAQVQKRAAAHVDGELRRPEPTHIRIRHSERRHNR
ncbi:hypothetical protein V2A60_005340 [Cordyceps javanica]|uniref:Uncharacterized protein n=1 Tax=Cordyceps javanica TaxID=43265 RepID=A0A545W8T1_9HYPO|nr:hypothetical protein IF1G_02134 [Cordyceps javanica]TQW10411.1 hypothetical protein IF2G_01353 [Cordyceps javanica]